MRKGLGLMLLMLSALLTGCSGKNVEAQAYAVSLGMDMSAENGIEVSVQVPTLNQGGGSSSDGGDGGGGGKGYTFSTAAGETLTEALEILNASIPRELNLTGVKSVVVSEKLARSEQFAQVLNELSLAYRVYGAAELVVCREEAKELIERQQPVIGLRLSESTTVALEHYRETGNIPSAKAADVFYLSRSIYGDPVAIMASIGGAGNGQDGDEYAGGLDTTGDDANQYFGSAVMTGGRMVGMLTGTQTQLLNVLLGELKIFSWVVDGIPVRLVVSGRPRIRIELSGSAPVISVGLTIEMMESERKLKTQRLEEVMTQRLEEMTGYCQNLGADPFRYAEWAAGQFLTVEEWMNYNWKEHFPRAKIQYDVTVRQREL